MGAGRLGEFERIARFFAPLARPEAFGLLDDAAIAPAGAQDYVLKTDAIVENVHFLPDDPPDRVAQKVLRANLSDLAGKGATPFGYLLTTVLPARCDEEWLAGLAAGLAADQAEFGIGLLGGDSVATAGPIVLSVTAVGTVPAGAMVRRAGARAGDLVCVSGTLGDAALGLRVRRGELDFLSEADRRHLAERYQLPRPRAGLGPRLLGTASAMMDVSDGLVADLGHLCDASGRGAVVELERLPLSPAARAALAARPELIAAPLAGGDDYELLFTVSQHLAPTLPAIAEAAGVPVAVIGRIESGERPRVVDGAGREIEIGETGYRHF
jgi:thiamine-monophosphate kinase